MMQDKRSLTQTIATSLPVPVEFITSDHVQCTKCLTVLGIVTTDNGRTVLIVDHLRLIMVEGVCGKCGTPFRWTSSQRALNRLLKHYPKS